MERHEPLPDGVPPPSTGWLAAQINRDLRWIRQQVDGRIESIERKLSLLSEPPPS